MNNQIIDTAPEQGNTEMLSSNIRQIETTNRLLAHIEDKLNNLIYNKKASPKIQKFSEYTKKNAENQQLKDKKDSIYAREQIIMNENINPNEYYQSKNSVQQQDQAGSFFRKTPSQQDEYLEKYIDNENKANQHQFKPTTLSSNKQGGQIVRNGQSNQINNQFYNQTNNGVAVNKSNRSNTDFQSNATQGVAKYEDISSSNRKKLDEFNYLLLGKEDQDPSPSQISSSNNNQQQFGGTLEYTKSHHFNSGTRQVEFDGDLMSSKSRSRNEQDIKYNNQDQSKLTDKNIDFYGLSVRSPLGQLHKKPFIQVQNNDDSLNLRVDKMDKFYESKIKILNDRVGLLENENQLLIDQKSQLNLDIIKLKQNIPINFMTESEYKDLEKKISRLEQQISRLSIDNTNLEREKNVLVNSLQHEIQELKTQNYKLIEENQQFRFELRDKSLNEANMKKQGSNNSLINYYKGAHQSINYSSRNVLGNEESHCLNKNPQNALDEIRNKYNIPRSNERSLIQGYEEDQFYSRQNPKYNQESQFINVDTNSNQRNNVLQPDISFLQQRQNQYDFNDNSELQQKPDYHPNTYQGDYRTNENSYSFLDEPSTRRNRIKQDQNTVVRDEIKRIKEELNRQKFENNNMVQKITDFKNQNNISTTTGNLINHQSVPAQQTDSHLMLENYRHYASQLEKSYEKLETLYQKEVQEKQTKIDELQNSMKKKKNVDGDEESQYKIKPKLKATSKSRKPSVTKKQTKPSNSITTLQSIGRSKSVLSMTKK